MRREQAEAVRECVIAVFAEAATLREFDLIRSVQDKILASSKDIKRVLDRMVKDQTLAIADEGQNGSFEYSMLEHSYVEPL